MENDPRKYDRLNSPDEGRYRAQNQSADEDEAGLAWMKGVVKEWTDEFRDSRQDIYNLDDGKGLSEDARRRKN
jgi:hypothetical protein